MRLPILRAVSIAFSLLLLAASSARASEISDTGTGYAYYYESGANSIADGQVSPGPVLQTNPSSPLPFSASQSASSSAASGSVNVSISDSNGNVGLHGTAISNAPPSSEASAGFDLYFYDLFTITGTGTEEFMYTLALNDEASVSDNGVAGQSVTSTAFLTLYANSSYQTFGTVTGNCGNYFYGGESDCGVISGVNGSASDVENTYGGTATGDLYLQAGTSIELGLFLSVRTSADNEGFAGSADSTAEFLGGDTGFFTLTPVTPGAGFTTASGLTYAADPDDVLSSTPEPSSLTLLATGLLGTAALLRRKIRNAT
jgi:hypothetical protein